MEAVVVMEATGAMEAMVALAATEASVAVVASAAAEDLVAGAEASCPLVPAVGAVKTHLVPATDDRELH